jgi:hypothetical protein
MSIQSWKWRNIDSTFQFIIFSGNKCADLPECIAVSKLPGLWTRFSGSAMAAPFIRLRRYSEQTRALRKLPNAFRTFTKDHRTCLSRMGESPEQWRKTACLANTVGPGLDGVRIFQIRHATTLHSNLRAWPVTQTFVYVSFRRRSAWSGLANFVSRPRVGQRPSARCKVLSLARKT